jgi:hypothetical protein
MLQFNVLYDDVATVKAIRATALANLQAGIVLTQFVSEGTQLTGVMAAPTVEVLIATERFLDEYYEQLIVETVPNFFTYP